MCTRPFKLPWRGAVDLATRLSVRHEVPCGQCIECRIHRSRHMALRCVHELKFHERSCFLTLTYRDSELVWGSQVPTLFPRHLQLFMKRLRRFYPDVRIKFFACGEYGDKSGRPHYHVILFGLDFYDDRKVDAVASSADYKMYRSAILDRVWTHGDCLLGDVTFDSIAYCARYTLKKLTGKGSSFYEALDIEPEFSRVSRGGRLKGSVGLGADYFDSFSSDFFPRDFALIPGKDVRLSVPQYYSRRFAKRDLLSYRHVVNARVDRAGTPDGLRDAQERLFSADARQAILRRKFDVFMRDFE